MIRPPRWRVYLRLGRVSNLPTVWTNTLAGIVLSGAPLAVRDAVALALAFSLFYVGGMFLNDAFDRESDAVGRPERPIPAGHIRASEVFAVGFGLLAAGQTMVARCAAGSAAVLSGAALGGLIVLYDAWHKKNPLSPLLMGACRVLVYITAALTVAGRLDAPVLVGAGLILAYLMAVTYAAKHEVRLRLAKGTVAQLIAGIALLDGVLIASRGALFAALAGVAGFGATLWLQRYVSGT